MWLVKLLLVVAVAYAGIVVLMYAVQTRLLFPVRLAAANGIPAGAQRVTVETPDGERLEGVHLPPSRHWEGKRLIVLGFGGNAWNAGYMAEYLHELYPDAAVVAFHYRGYAPSTGQPGAAALLADAVTVHDHIVATLGPGRIIAAGFSLGGGIAVHLARNRPLAGLILVSPFDSLEALAREHYPWVPVGLLLRHHIPVAESMRDLQVPVALIAAANDKVVPPRRTHALRQVVPNLMFDRTIAGAGHNDLYRRPEFRAAMAEALTLIVSR